MYSTVSFKASDHKKMLDWINSEKEASKEHDYKYEVISIWTQDNEINVLFIKEK